MRTIRLVAGAIVALMCAAVWASGCSRATGPLVPEAERGGAGFINSVPLFEPEDAVDDLGLESAGGFHEIALGTLARSALGAGTPGEQYTFNSYGTAAVSLLRPDSEDPQAPFKPVFRWLQGSPQGDLDPGTPTDIDWVTERDNDSSGSHVAEYRSVSCDAILACSEYPFSYDVELVVCYAVRGIPKEEVDDLLGDDFGEGGEFNTDWDIGLTVLRWDEENEFPDAEPARTDFLIPDGDWGGLAESQYPDYDPDVAYDHFSGNLYLVWSSAETPYGLDERVLKYVEFTREGDFQLVPRWEYDYRWDDGWPRDVQTDTSHNGYDASIDIGYLDFFHYPNIWTQNSLWVVVAYTSQFQGEHTGFHVMAGGWQVDHWGDRVFMPVRIKENGDYVKRDAGLPCVDITPNENDRNFAALVFAQDTGIDGYGPVMSVYEADLFGLGTILSTETNTDAFTVVPCPEEYPGDGLFPAIALHKETGTQGPFRASITFMAQAPQSDELKAAVIRLAITPQVNQFPPYLTADHEFVWGPEIVPGALSNISGNYNFSQIPFLDPGISTSVVIEPSGHRYWAAWCERIEMEPPPVNVCGTFGYTAE